MATFLQINFYSKALKRLVNFNALVPIDTFEIAGQEKVERGPMKALYLLHGYSGNHQDWVCGSKIQELSLMHNIAGIPEEFKDPIADYKYYTGVFGDFNELLGSDRDPEALIINMKKENKSITKIYMACGTEDFLLNENRNYHKFLDSEGVEHTYVEGPGIHDWNFWNEYIEKALIWALE